MNFITFTTFDYEDKSDVPIYIKDDSIIAFCRDGKFTTVFTTGKHSLMVKESPEEIIKLIENFKNRNRFGTQNLGNL